MSKITRFDVYGRAEYSDKGSLVLYDHHKEVVEDLERQLEEAREENEKLYSENLAITSFYTDLCDRLPKGSCAILGHGWHNVEKYIKRRHEAITIKKLKEQGR